LDEHYLQELTDVISTGSGHSYEYALVCRGALEAGAIRRAALASVLGGAAFAMPVYTFDQFAAELGRRLGLPARRSIGDIQRELLVAECLAQHAAAEAGGGELKLLARGAGMTGVARSLAELFVEWDQAGADPESLEQALTVGASAGALEALALWRRYLDALRDAGRAENGQLLMRAVRALEQPAQAAAAHRFTRIRIVGFPWLSGCEAKLASALARWGADVEVEVRHAEPDAFDHMVKAVSPARVRSVPLARVEALPHLIAAAGPRREARAVARKVKKLLADGAEAPRVWVASADSEGFTRELLEAFHEFGVPTSAPRKRTMRESPLIADCLKFAGLVAAEAAGHRDVDVMPLIASVYLGDGPEAGAQVAKALGVRGLRLSLKAWARRLERLGDPGRPGQQAQPEPAVPGVGCVRGLEQAITDARAAAKAAGGTGLARCAEGFREALHALGLPASIWRRQGDDRLRAEEWQAWTALEGLLREVASAEVGPPGSARGEAGSGPDWDEFVSVLDFTAGRRSYALTRPLSTGVAVMGINRAASVGADECDALFLCGLGDQWLPARRRRPWVLSEGDVRAIAAAGFGSEPLGDRASADRHAFACAARSGVGSIYLTWSTSTDDGAVARRSFLVDEHLREHGVEEADEGGLTTAVSAAEVFPGNVDEAASRREATMAAMHTRLELAGDEGFAAMRQRWSRRADVSGVDGRYSGMVGPSWASGRRDWSERSLNMYTLCPFQFFCNYVLRVMASDEVEDDIDARDRGSMLHEVVKQFEAELGGNPPDPALADAYAKRIVEIAKVVFGAGQCERSSVPGNLARAFYSGMARRLTGFVHSEVERAASTGGVWSPDKLEWTFGSAFGRSGTAVEVTAGDVRVSVRGVVDRIDRGPGGIMAIYDYKSSKPPSLTAVVNGSELQLGLYALVAEEVFGAPVAGVWYIQLPAEGRGTGAFREAFAKHVASASSQQRMSEAKWQAFMDVVRERLAQCHRGEQAGEFAPTPSKHNCRNCKYPSVCRAGYADEGESGE